MFGRLGAVGGSNFVGLLLDSDCELIFYLYGALILSKFQPSTNLSKLTAEIIFFFFFLFSVHNESGCAILCFFLNTNPMEKSSFTKDHQDEMKRES